jgi:3-hydroxyacyl-CoA dehydrogenase
VAAVHGYCLGAGLELAFAAPRMVAHPEANIGLPEAKVGLLPGGAGACRMASIAQALPQSAQAAAAIVANLAQGVTSVGATDAMRLHYVRPDDRILLHPDRLITDARELARHVEPTGLPDWNPLGGPVMGMIEDGLKKLVADGKITEYDLHIGERIRHVFTKSTSWEHAKATERAEFVDLMKHGQTVARIRHMLETGKPLRN